MEYVSMAINILFIVFLAFGFLLGLMRGLKKTLSRSIWVILTIVLLIPLSMSITSMLLKINISITVEGQSCQNLYEALMVILKDAIFVEGANYEGLVEIVMFFISMALNGIIFILLYYIIKLVTMPLYWITNAFILAKDRRAKRKAKKNKEKIKIKKHRFAGALVGAVLGLLSFLMTITPIVGYVNLAKIVEKETTNSEGKGVLSQNIGDTYTDLINAYDSSVPISLISSIGADKLLLGIFDGLTSNTINNKKVVLSKEAVYFSKIYNEAIEIENPDLNTISQDELSSTLNECEELVEAVFNSQLISASSDVIIQFGVKYARQNINTENFKPYVLDFYNVLFDEMEKLDSSTTKHELVSILGLVESLNDNNLLLPIIQKSEELNITFLQNNLTRAASDEIVEKLFAINTVNNVAPALVNFLLGFSAEKLDYNYSSESVITSQALKQSANVLVESVVDLLENYSDDNTTKVAINETTVNAFGAILDEIKKVLSEENFVSVVNSIEPKLQDIALNGLESQPEFLKETVREAIGNISEVSSFKTELTNVYEAVKVVETQFKDAKVNDDYDVQYMDFIKIGGALDDVQSSVLFKDDLLLRTMNSAVEYYSDKIEKDISTEEKPFEFTVDTQIIANINELKDGDGIKWQSELPKYKNTVGIFLNLFQTDSAVLDKIKSDSDSSLEELGKELDGDLSESALFKGTDRLLVADLLNLADIKVNSSNDEDLSTLLQDARANVLNEQISIDWEDEFFHIKQLIKLEFGDVSDNSLIAIGQAIDKVVFDYDNGERIVSKSTIFTQDIINNYIANYMDNVFAGITEEDDFYSTISMIKTSFNNETISSYATEIEALLKLKEVKTLVEADGFDFKTGIPRGGIQLGRKIDEALAIGGVVVDNALVNDFITKKIDTYFEEYSDMSKELEQIKLGFDDDVEKYEVEFTALLRLMDVSDVANESGFDFKNKTSAINLGSSIDTAVGVVTIDEAGYYSKIVTTDLVNGYIKRYITDNITLDDDSQFGDIIVKITGTKTGDEFGEGRLDTMGHTYAREFGYLSQLLIVSDAFTDITLSTIDEPNETLNSTLAEQFDGNDGTNGRAEVSDPLINSYLVGDSLLVAIDNALETYTKDTDNAKYSEILQEVNANYSDTNGIRDYVIWIGNVDKEGNLKGQLYYTNLIAAFVEIDEILNSSLTASISQPTDLTPTLASEYDSTIYELQGDGETTYGNILLQTNGVNKLTKFALNKVKTALQNQQDYFSEEIAYIDNYIAFLDGYLPVDLETKVDTKYYYLPYGTNETYYAYLYSEEDDLWVIEEENNNSGIQINTPFTYLSGLING